MVVAFETTMTHHPVGDLYISERDCFQPVAVYWMAVYTYILYMYKGKSKMREIEEETLEYADVGIFIIDREFFFS